MYDSGALSATGAVDLETILQPEIKTVIRMSGNNMQMEMEKVIAAHPCPKRAED